MRPVRAKGYLAVAAALALIGAAVGCGGDSTKYSRAASQRCLKEAGAKPDPDAIDEVAASAAQGAFAVQFEGNFVTLAFDNSVDDAEQTMEQFEQLRTGGSFLERKGTVVLSWDNEPTDDQRETIEDCLESE